MVLAQMLRFGEDQHSTGDQRNDRIIGIVFGTASVGGALLRIHVPLKVSSHRQSWGTKLGDKVGGQSWGTKLGDKVGGQSWATKLGDSAGCWLDCDDASKNNPVIQSIGSVLRVLLRHHEAILAIN